MDNNDKTYIGIDLGTQNIGYAVSDANYKIIKVGKKNALGVYTYSDENTKANSAADRRAFRTARRRQDRRKFRIVLLQELFAQAMAAKDETFFLRLHENDLHLSDKSTSYKFSLFNDTDYNDREYHKQYKTVYHLRKDLIENGTDDVRKLYLAIHHIVKYRGHFLLDGEMGAHNDIAPLLKEINVAIDERNIEIDEIDEANKLPLINENCAKELTDIFKNDKLRKKQKIEKVNEILHASDSIKKHLVTAIFGYKIDVIKLFGKSQYEKDEVKTFAFSDNYDEILPSLMDKLSDKDYKIIECLKSLYDFAALTSLLKGKDCISDAMIDKYNKHRADLKILKKFIKTYAADKYADMFDTPIIHSEKGDKIDDKKKNYTYYIGGGRPMGKDKYCNGRLGDTCSTQDFYKYVRSIIEPIKIADCEVEKQLILDEIDNGTFMPKIVSKDNSMLPYQLNMHELQLILQKTMKNSNFAWLNDTDEYGSVADKIKSLLWFRVPYYVGPLKVYKDEKQNKFAWAVRKKQGRITPWNFKTKVDEEKSNEKFIERMLNKCTYLRDKFALPMNSIAYLEHIALNELNKLKINGELIATDLKQQIWEELYTKSASAPNVKKIIKFLLSKGYENFKITGYDGNLKGNIKSYHMLKSIIGNKVDSDRAMAERLILLMTIHNESKILENAIRHEFAGKLSDEEIKKLKGVKFNGWGRYSMELLQGTFDSGIKLHDAQGEYWTILDIMKNTTLNFMEIINKKELGFKDALQNYNVDHGITVNNKITFEDVKSMYCSPSVKRSVWQTFSLIKTLVKETGRQPAKIFIEVTRGEDEKKKGSTTKSRKEMLELLYRDAIKLKDDCYKDELEKFNKKLQLKDNKDLNAEKIYLYFLQLGRCAYSNRAIDIEDLNACDIDHIIPRARKKDDSLDNKVLVYGIHNKEKEDNYPVPSEYRTVQTLNLWTYLNKIKLMSDEKLNRLKRVTPITADEQKGFINRQLVETNQMALLVRDLLEQWLNPNDQKNTEIVLTKGGNVSDFRKKYCIVKSRDINEFHHAADAYLNIVVGNVLNEKFNHDWKYKVDDFMTKEAAADVISDGINDVKNDNRRNSYKFIETFDNDVYSNREGKRLIWKRGEKGTIESIRKQLDTHNFNVVKKTIMQKGELFKSTIYKADKTNKIITGKYTLQEPVGADDNGKEKNPMSDSTKYGYKKTSSTAYFVVIDAEDKKRNSRRSIEAISIFDNKKIKSGKLTLEEVLVKKGNINAKLANIDGLKSSIIKIGTLLDVNGTRLRISGATGNVLQFHNANQLYAPNDIVRYVKELSLINDKILKATSVVSKEDKLQAAQKQFNILEADKERRISDKNNKKKDIILITKNRNIELYEFYVNKISNKPYALIPGYAPTVNLLRNVHDRFSNMGLYDQLVVLLKLMVAFECNASKIDTSDLYYFDESGRKVNGSKIAGSIAITKNKLNEYAIKIILQSRTGLKERVIKLA